MKQKTKTVVALILADIMLFIIFVIFNAISFIATSPSLMTAYSITRIIMLLTMGSIFGMIFIVAIFGK